MFKTNHSKICLVVGGATGAIIYYNRSLIARLVREKVDPIRNFSWLVDLMSSAVGHDRRQDFKDSMDGELVKHGFMRNHSHPEAARLRCVANTLLDSFAAVYGLKPYKLSGSKADMMYHQGSHSYYSAKDLAYKSRNDSMRNIDAIFMTDVDYYVDMDKYLKGKHLCIYTFCPVSVSGVTADAVYTVNNNSIDFHVNGGGHYSHQLWDYETDVVISDHWYGSTIYLVESVALTKDRRIVFFNFVRHVYGPVGWLIPGYRMKRRQLSFNDLSYIRSQYKVADKLRTMHSISHRGARVSADIDDETLQSVIIRVKMNDKPAISDVERILRTHNPDTAFYMAPLVFKAVTNNDFMRVLDLPGVSVTDISHRHYQTLRPLIYEDAKPTMRPIAPRYMDTAEYPGRSHNNDHACIQGRIKDVANRVTDYPPFYLQCLNDFLCELIKVPGSLVPYDYEYMEDKWKRPTQRNLLKSVTGFLYSDSGFKVKSFQKTEAYNKITAPRNISTLPTDHNVRWGQFTNAMAALLKEQPWYAFGKHPTDVTQRIRDMCASSTKLVGDDTSKLDGSTGEIHQLLQKGMYLRGFAPIYHKEIKTCLHNESRATGVTQTGVKYSTKDTTLSGSSGTSVRNTTITAFQHYLTYRKMGMDSKTAYAKLGIYGGDDGLSADINMRMLEQVYASTGILLKAESIESNGPVKFLGRVYTNPWVCNDCIADVPRQMAKVHLTASPATVPTAVALVRKAEAVLITDAMTPILSNWARAIIRIFGSQDTDKGKYKNEVRDDVNWWAQYRSPFDPLTSLELARTTVSDAFGGIDIQWWCQFFDKARTELDLVTDARLSREERRVEIEAVTGGEIRTPQRVVDHQAEVRARMPIPTGKKTVKTRVKAPTAIPVAVESNDVPSINRIIRAENEPAAAADPMAQLQQARLARPADVEVNIIASAPIDTPETRTGARVIRTKAQKRKERRRRAPVAADS